MSHRTRVVTIVLSAVALVVAAVVLVVALQMPDTADDAAREERDPGAVPSQGADEAPQKAAVTPDVTAPPEMTVPQATAAGCPEPTVRVTNAAELAEALAAAQAGDVIGLTAGVYGGNFVASAAGAPEQPITLCGDAETILDGGTTNKGYVLHVDDSSHWVLQGFTVRNGQKGVMVDRSTHLVIQGLTVTTIGDEAIHLRRFSTDNRVVGNTISDTGHRRPKFGEGIYIGTAESNWCDISECQPDRSDRNEITGNTIFGTTSESVDIKEGTSDGLLHSNTFEGSAITGADSWVDVKGRNWVISENTGTNSPQDGFQTHEIVDGWGTDNVFRGNVAEVNGPGLGYALKPVRGNVVGCSNTASGAGEGLSNEPCTYG